jgi:hypothetical protein
MINKQKHQHVGYNNGKHKTEKIDYYDIPFNLKVVWYETNYDYWHSLQSNSSVVWDVVECSKFFLASCNIPFSFSWLQIWISLIIDLSVRACMSVLPPATLSSKKNNSRFEISQMIKFMKNNINTYILK